MRLDSLVKRASHDPVTARALMTMIKIAQNDSNENTQFNESVPAADIDPLTGQPAAQQEQGWSPQSSATTTGYAQESQYLPSDQAAMLQQGGIQSGNPLVAGAEAARVFVGQDVFAAAMQGDPNAMNLVTQVASTIANGSTGSVQPAAMEGQPMAEDMQGAPDEMQQPNSFAEAGIPATPEEQIANMIVQPVEAAPAQPQDPQASAEGGEKKPQKNGSPSVTVKVNGVGQEKTSSYNRNILSILSRNVR